MHNKKAYYFFLFQWIIYCHGNSKGSGHILIRKQVYQFQGHNLADNILIFSKTREEHLVHVHMVLETLLHHKLYSKAWKCQFCRSSVSVLSYVIFERCVAVDWLGPT